MSTLFMFFSFPALIFVIILFLIAFKPSCDTSSKPKPKPSHIFTASVPPNIIPKLKKYNPIGSTNLWSKGSYHTYLQSNQWNLVGLKVLSRDQFKCVKCGSILDLNVHHLTYENVYFEEDHLADLETLCSTCHSAVDHGPILETWS